MRVKALRAALIPLLFLLIPVGSSFHAYAAVPVCASRVAALGVDMSAGGRFEVQRALAVGPHTLQLDETMPDEQAMAHGLFPSDLLGSFAVSSALLHPLPAGSGLTVTLNQGIRLETAQSYANALLTAGVTDADVGVAAPTSQQTLGATALLGLLRAAAPACLAISPARRDLAMREIVLSSELAQQIGRQAAPALLFALKTDATTQKLTAPAALASLVTRDAVAQSVRVPAANRAALVTFLHDLVVSGAYSAIAAAHPTIAGSGPLRATVRLSATRPAVRTAPTAAGVWRGTIVGTGNQQIALRLPNGVRDFALAQGAGIYRDGQPGALSALRAGETITVTTNAAGAAMRVDAAGAAVSATRRTQAAPAQNSSLNAPAIAVLALLILLALALLPLLVGYLRSRKPLVAGTVAQARVPLFAARGRPSLRQRAVPVQPMNDDEPDDDE